MSGDQKIVWIMWITYILAHINCSALAREFGLKDIGDYQSDNKNQVVKKFLALQENNVDLDQFVQHRNQQTQHNLRRKKEEINF